MSTGRPPCVSVTRLPSPSAATAISTSVEPGPTESFPTQPHVNESLCGGTSRSTGRAPRCDGINDHPSGSGTQLFFAHSGFAAPDPMLGHTAYTWALLMDHLRRYAETGGADPFFKS